MSHPGKKREKQPCETLYISLIPANSCTIPTIFNHFKNYGHIKSIYAFGTNASITFSSVEDAQTAFKSPEAFVNNRFVRYHYHNDPAKALDHLSSVVDQDHVQSVLKTVKENIAQRQRDTIQIQSQLKNSSQHSETKNQSNETENSQVDDIIMYKPQIEQKLKELREELKHADPERKAEIQRDIEENEGVINAINSLMQQS